MVVHYKAQRLASQKWQLFKRVSDGITKDLTLEKLEKIKAVLDEA